MALAQTDARKLMHDDPELSAPWPGGAGASLADESGSGAAPDECRLRPDRSCLVLFANVLKKFFTWRCGCGNNSATIMEDAMKEAMNPADPHAEGRRRRYGRARRAVRDPVRRAVAARHGLSFCPALCPPRMTVRLAWPTVRRFQTRHCRRHPFGCAAVSLDVQAAAWAASMACRRPPARAGSTGGGSCSRRPGGGLRSRRTGRGEPGRRPSAWPAGPRGGFQFEAACDRGDLTQHGSRGLTQGHQAFTSWANSATRPSFTTTSAVTVDPHNGERRRALACGAESLPRWGISAASARCVRSRA